MKEPALIDAAAGLAGPALTASFLIDEKKWQSELMASYSSVDALEQAGILLAEEARLARSAGDAYRVRVPRYYADLMDLSPEGRAHCPIRRQALPSALEEDPRLPAWAQEMSASAFGRVEPWTDDAIGDIAKLAAPRLTHRYGSRAILHVSSLCGMYCRFCFRKSHLNDSERTLYEGSLEPALNYLLEHSEIRELILTGGDPLSLPDRWLAKFFERLREIRSIRHVRVHSRMAVTLPSRLTDELSSILSSQPFGVALVSHYNHPRELSAFARASLSKMRRAGVSLYNQSVLLKGVNDSADTLAELFQELYELGVRPFYLHHPDWTPGTFHFRIPIERGQQLIRELAGRLSGPALPQYVLDVPGGAGKTVLTDARVQKLEERIADGIGGAVYEVPLPETREHANATKRYAEFWRNT